MSPGFHGSLEVHVLKCMTSPSPPQALGLCKVQAAAPQGCGLCAGPTGSRQSPSKASHGGDLNKSQTQAFLPRPCCPQQTEEWQPR